MKISVITATWNSSVTLCDTMRSVVEQIPALSELNAELEYIIIDGASNDGTVDIICEFESQFGDCLKWISEPDKGIYDAMNKGIEMATGDVIGILNSDDFYTSNDCLATIVNEFSLDNNLDATYGDIHFVNDNNLNKCVRYYSSKLFRPWMMRFGMMPAHPSFYCKREIYKRYGVFNIEYKIGADFENLLRLIFKNHIKTVYISKDFVTMRTGGVSTDGLQARIRIMQEHIKAFKANGIYSNRLILSLRYIYKIYELIKNNMISKQNIALITGITGQDGSFLAELLLEKGYDVHGTIRRSSVDFRERIVHLEGKPHFHLHYADLGDSMSIIQVMNKVRPTEIYNLAAQSHVQVSFDSPEFTADVDATGVLRVLEAVRQCGLASTCRIYQASTSELYGKVEEVPQSEKTPFHPYSPYAVAKLYGYWIVKEYREAYNMFCCSGILFNHESERRGETFVTRKITLAAARIAQGKQDKLYLGNLSSLRDWGYAKDYVECMWLILQNKQPEDFVIATGEQHSVREFCYLAFKHAGIELEFQGEGIDEKGIDKVTGKVLVEVSEDFYRPTDVVNLWGDPTKARTELGWNPGKTPLTELVRIMVDHDMEKVAVERVQDEVKTNLAEYLEKGIVK